jgi:thymidine kinase
MSELVGYLGTMNSMKSLMALAKAHKYKEDGESYIAFKPKDDRDGEYIQSRALPHKLKANIILPEESGMMYTSARFMKPDHIIVDEVQFMSPIHIEELRDIVTDFGIKVECYGLKVDFQTNLFPASRRLIELADRIIDIENDCATTGCRNPATQNMRLEDGRPIFHGEVIKVGKEESYRSVCAACYFKEKKESEKDAPRV